MRAGLVEPVGIDDRVRRRKLRLAHVMIDHDHREPGVRRHRERGEGGRAAVDRDDEPDALGLEAQKGRRIRAVALLEAVGDVDADGHAEGGEEALQKCGRGSTIDIVIPEDADRLARHHGVGDARGGTLHVAQVEGVGQKRAERGVQEGLRLLEADAAPREHARHGLRQLETLRQRQRRAIVEPARRPAPPAERALDAEKGIVFRQSLRRQLRHPSTPSPSFPRSRRQSDEMRHRPPESSDAPSRHCLSLNFPTRNGAASLSS